MTILRKRLLIEKVRVVEKIFLKFLEQGKNSKGSSITE